MGRAVYLWLVVAAGAFFSLRYAIPYARMDLALDFKVFWRAASAPMEQVYAPGHTPFVYPPTGLLAVQPLALVPLRPGYFAWTLASAILFGWGAFRLAGARATALSFLSPAAVKGLILGQSAMLFSSPLIWAVLQPSLLSGAALGAVLLVKPQLFFLAPLAFLIRGDWRLLSGMLLGGGALLALSLLAFGPQIWLQWLEALPGFREVLIRDGVLARAVTPAARAEWGGMPAWPFLLSGLLLGTAAICSSAKRLAPAELAALIVASSLVASPYAHVHDTIALIPLCLLFVQRGRWWMAIPAGVVFTGAPGFVTLALMVGLIVVVLESLYLNRQTEPVVPSDNPPAGRAEGLAN